MKLTVRSAKMTFGQAAGIHLRNVDDDVRIKPRTRDYRACFGCRKIRIVDLSDARQNNAWQD